MIFIEYSLNFQWANSVVFIIFWCVFFFKYLSSTYLFNRVLSLRSLLLMNSQMFTDALLWNISFTWLVYPKGTNALRQIPVRPAQKSSGPKENICTRLYFFWIEFLRLVCRVGGIVRGTTTKSGRFAKQETRDPIRFKRMYLWLLCSHLQFKSIHTQFFVCNAYQDDYIDYSHTDISNFHFIVL